MQSTCALGFAHALDAERCKSASNCTHSPPARLRKGKPGREAIQKGKTKAHVTASPYLRSATNGQLSPAQAHRTPLAAAGRSPVLGVSRRLAVVGDGRGGVRCEREHIARSHGTTQEQPRRRRDGRRDYREPRREPDALLRAHGRMSARRRHPPGRPSRRRQSDVQQ